MPSQVCFKDLLKFQQHYLIFEEHLFSRTALNGCICSKQKTSSSKKLQQGPFVPISSVALDRIRSLLNICFNDMQIKRWLHLSTSLWGTTLCCNLFRERIVQKQIILWQQLTELYQLFNGQILRIPRYFGKVSTREGRKQIAMQLQILMFHKQAQ